MYPYAFFSSPSFCHIAKTSSTNFCSMSFACAVGQKILKDNFTLPISEVPIIKEGSGPDILIPKRFSVNAL